MTKTTAMMTIPADSRAIAIGYHKKSVQICKNEKTAQQKKKLIDSRTKNIHYCL